MHETCTSGDYLNAFVDRVLAVGHGISHPKLYPFHLKSSQSTVYLHGLAFANVLRLKPAIIPCQAHFGMSLKTWAGGANGEGCRSAGEATSGRDRKHRRRACSPTRGLVVGRPPRWQGDIVAWDEATFAPADVLLCPPPPTRSLGLSQQTRASSVGGGAVLIIECLEGGGGVGRGNVRPCVVGRTPPAHGWAGTCGQSETAVEGD